MSTDHRDELAHATDPIQTVKLAILGNGVPMAHISFEYSANVENLVDMNAFSSHLRDAMRDSGIFPLGGIRVRGVRVDAHALANGDDQIGFIDMILRMGQGRDQATRESVVEIVYTAAETWLKPFIGDRPFALSLEVIEIEKAMSEKRFNNLHAFLSAGEANGG